MARGDLSRRKELLFEFAGLIQMSSLLALDMVLEDAQDLNLRKWWMSIIKISEEISSLEWSSTVY